MAGGMTYAPPQIALPARQTQPTPAMGPVVQRAPIAPGTPHMQAAFARNFAAMLAGSGAGSGPAARPSRRALPPALKAKTERASGLPLDDVTVHYDSLEPETIQAHAFARGSDIHLGPGQERHLPHEAWHVVQQKQGRVRPTTTIGGMALNDEAGLEREADYAHGAPTWVGGSTDEPGVGGSAVAQRIKFSIGDKTVDVTTIKAFNDNPKLKAAIKTHMGRDAFDIQEAKIVEDQLMKTDTMTIAEFFNLPEMLKLKTPSNMYGDFTAVNSLTMKRRDSKNNLLTYSFQKEFDDNRDKADRYRAKQGTTSKREKTNIITGSITVNYRIGDSNNPQQVSAPINSIWTSTYKQPVSSGGDFSWPTGNATVAEKQRAADQIAKPAYAKGQLSPVFSQVKMDAGKPKVNTTAQVHSELFVVSDPSLPQNFQTTLASLYDKLEEDAVVVSDVLIMDSSPNAMCMGLCRPHMGTVGETFSRSSKDVDLRKRKRSSKFGSVLMVTSATEFQAEQNKRASRFNADNPETTESFFTSTGEKSRFEVTPRAKKKLRTTSSGAALATKTKSDNESNSDEEEEDV